MKSIKDLIYYYRRCPLCNSWLTIDVDLPNTTALEIKDDRVSITIIKENEDPNITFDILFKNNKVISDGPLYIDNIVFMIKRLYYDNYTEIFKLEVRCYNCNNFRYWSNTLRYDEEKRLIKNIGISGEKFQIHDINSNNEKISYVVFNNYKDNTSKMLISKSNEKPYVIDVPFTPFSQIDFNNKEKLMRYIRNVSILG